MLQVDVGRVSPIKLYALQMMEIVFHKVSITSTPTQRPGLRSVSPCSSPSRPALREHCRFPSELQYAQVADRFDAQQLKAELLSLSQADTDWHAQLGEGTVHVRWQVPPKVTLGRLMEETCSG